MVTDDWVTFITGHFQQLRVMLMCNDGRGFFHPLIIDRGRESHLGAMPCDLEGDHDLDLVRIARDNPQYVHFWRNGTPRERVVPAGLTN